MKALAAALLVSLAPTVYAEDINFHYGVAIHQEGAIIDAGTDSIRIELLTTGGISLKYGFKPTNNLTTWVGFGKFWKQEATISDYTGNWDNSSITRSFYHPAAFVEVEHSSGVFVRVAHYGSTEYMNFFETDSTGVVNSKFKPVNVYGTLLWTGYKWRF